MQTRTKDVTEERMITLERSLATLVAQKKVSPLEAEKWANHRTTFHDELKRVQEEMRAAEKGKSKRKAKVARE